MEDTKVSKLLLRIRVEKSSVIEQVPELYSYVFRAVKKEVNNCKRSLSDGAYIR